MQKISGRNGVKKLKKNSSPKLILKVINGLDDVLIANKNNPSDSFYKERIVF